MKTSLRFALVSLCAVAAAPASAGIAVHACDVHYRWTSVDASDAGNDETVLLAEGFKSNVMLAAESSDRDRVDLDVSVSPDGKVAGEIVPPLGVAPGHLDVDGSFANAANDVFGRITCSPERRQVSSVFRDNEDGNLFSVSEGLPRWEASHAASVLMHRKMCYFGSATDALETASSAVSGRAQAALESGAISLKWMDEIGCSSSNGQQYEGYVCFEPVVSETSQAIEPCGDAPWINWKNIPYVPPVRTF